MSLSRQQGRLQSVWVLDLWTADGHWTAAIHQTVLPSALSINVTEHQHYILSKIYKVKLVSSLIFDSLSSDFRVLFFPPPSHTLLISDPQFTTLLQSLCSRAGAALFYLPVLSRWASVSAEKEMAWYSSLLSITSLQVSICPMSFIQNLEFWGLVQILLGIYAQYGQAT